MLYLGIDCGGSKTSCAVGDDSQLLGVGKSGAANIVRVGTDRSRCAIQSAVLQACQQAAVSPAKIARSYIGAAGISAPGVKDSLRQFVSEVAAGAVEVGGDHEIALEAAFAGGPGVVVAAGTGSIAFGRNAERKEARCGGYGFAISDEGSGHWIGRKAVALTMRVQDEGGRTRLGEAIPQAWNVEPRDLVKFANSIPPPDFARLFPVVVETANAGDTVATKLLQRAASELVEIARVVRSKLWEEGETVPVAMLGGVFEHSAVIRAEFVSVLSAQCFWKLDSQVANPLSGALSLARKQVREMAFQS
jgi:N-acetylglucosamine kinase-like BadF-type ATPase